MNATLNHAPNLTQRPPRSPRVRLGGYVVLARILDKGRAEIAGTAGDYKYNNPIDHHWFRFTGLTAETLKAELATGKGDGEMLAWIEQNAPANAHRGRSNSGAPTTTSADQMAMSKHSSFSPIKSATSARFAKM
jgi:hypothetical protein